MKKYDAIFILNDRKFDDGGKAYSAKVEEALKECGAEEISSNSLGRKQFARNIGKKSSGLYWRFIFNLDPAQVAVFEDKFRLEDNVLRTVVFNYDVPADARMLDMSH